MEFVDIIFFFNRVDILLVYIQSSIYELYTVET